MDRLKVNLICEFLSLVIKIGGLCSGNKMVEVQDLALFLDLVAFRRCAVELCQSNERTG